MGRQEAQAAAAALTPADERTLRLLARLPLISVAVLERLIGQSGGGGGAHRAVRRLTEAGLVETVRASLWPFRAGPPPRLLYLTTLGAAVATLIEDAIPVGGKATADDAAHSREGYGDGLSAGHGAPPSLHGPSRRPALSRLVAGIGHLAATYALLAALAATEGGDAVPHLQAWERPWRRRFRPPTLTRPLTASLPAQATFRGGPEEAGRLAAYLLLPDLATAPVRAHRSAMVRLVRFRAWAMGARAAGTFPTLVIATTEQRRAGAWRGLLDDVRRGDREAPLDALVVTWNGLPVRVRPGNHDADAALIRVAEARPAARPPPAQPAASTDPSGSGAPLPARAWQRARAVPAPVGASQASRGASGLSPAALAVTTVDRLILDRVGRHPFLSLGDLATLLDRPHDWAHQRRDRLIDRDLLRVLQPPEVGAADGLTELTLPGLRLVAAQQGLSTSLRCEMRLLTARLYTGLLWTTV